MIIISIIVIIISQEFFILLESTIAKPLDDSENLNSKDVIKKPGFIDTDNRDIKFKKPIYADSFVTTVSGDTEVSLNPEIITSGNIDPAESIELPATSSPAFVELTTLNLSNEEPDDLIATSGPGDSSVVTSKPGFWTPDSLVTTPKPVSGGTESLVTSLKPDSGEPASLVTDPEPGKLPTGLESGSGEPDSFTTTFIPVASLVTNFEPDSGTLNSFATTVERDSEPTSIGPGSTEAESLLTTLKPDFKDPDDSSETLPVKNGRSNGALGSKSSCVIIIVGILFISSSQVI